MAKVFKEGELVWTRVSMRNAWESGLYVRYADYTSNNHEPLCHQVRFPRGISAFSDKEILSEEEYAIRVLAT